MAEGNQLNGTPRADISIDAHVHESATVWGLAQVREGAEVGADCVIGRGAYIGVGVKLGRRVKVQNFALLYEPAVIGDGVFIGPGAVLTNDRRPRAVTVDGRLKSPSDWTAVGVQIGEGASIGAGVICVAPVHVGAWSLVGAGALVVSDVPAHALMIGSPARQVGWVGRSGERLVADATNGTWRCPVSGEEYEETAVGLQLLRRSS